MNKTEYRWIETLILAGLMRTRETQEGEKLETFEDLYAEHDKVMESLNKFLLGVGDSYQRNVCVDTGGEIYYKSGSVKTY